MIASVAMEIRGNVFCFAGKFPVDTTPMKKRLEREGGRVVDFADPDARVAVIGDKATSKRKAAGKRGLVIVDWMQLVSAINAAAPSAGLPAPAKPAGPRNPRQLMIQLNRADPRDGDAIADILIRALDNDVTLELDSDAPATADPSVSVWLLAWCSDADGCELYLVPEDALDDQKRADLAAIDGACFADSNDVDAATLGAAVRVIAGLTFVGNRDPDQLAEQLWQGWQDELAAGSGIADATDLRPLIGWLVPMHTRSLADVRRSFARVVAVNRAM